MQPKCRECGCFILRGTICNSAECRRKQEEKGRARAIYVKNGLIWRDRRIAYGLPDWALLGMVYRIEGRPYGLFAEKDETGYTIAYHYRSLGYFVD